MIFKLNSVNKKSSNEPNLKMSLIEFLRIGRRPVFYLSAAIIIIGRVMTTLTTSTYFLFVIASLASMLTSMSIFLSPLIIAMETSKEEDRAHIAMMQVS
jgi:MFS family permease